MKNNALLKKAKLPTWIFLMAWIMITTNLCVAQAVPDSLKIKQTDTILSKTPEDEFKEDLTSGFQDFDTAKNLNEMMSASNRLGLIAKKWPDQWTANYYAGYSLIILSYIEKDDKKKDAYLDDAELLVKKAKEEYNKSYDELYVLEALLANARLAVKPMSRYKKQGDLFNQNLDTAKTLQPDNPRIYYLLGTSFYYTPKMFGGGTEKARPYFEKAEELFLNEKKFDICIPYWGKRQNTELLAKCRNASK